MSQPNLETPDPSAQALGSTDDLLSKLAGDEIDRLLADAEVDRPAETPAAKPAIPAAAVDTELASQIDQLLVDKKTAPAAAPDAPPVDAAEEARLNKLADELEVDQQPSPVISEGGEESDDENDDDGPPLRLAIDRPLPIWLRPLEWINSPLDAQPDWVRPAMGKIAIATLINALAIFGYVVIFRRHH
jgi:hypothetical protein